MSSVFRQVQEMPRALGSFVRYFGGTEDQQRYDWRVGAAVDDEAGFVETTTEVASVPRQLTHPTCTCTHSIVHLVSASVYRPLSAFKTQEISDSLKIPQHFLYE